MHENGKKIINDSINLTDYYFSKLVFLEKLLK